MVKALSDHYGVPFERDRARAIVVGLVRAHADGLGWWLRRPALFGAGQRPCWPRGFLVTAAACTRSIGRVFVEHFESGAPLTKCAS